MKGAALRGTYGKLFRAPTLVVTVEDFVDSTSSTGLTHTMFLRAGNTELGSVHATALVDGRLVSVALLDTNGMDGSTPNSADVGFATFNASAIGSYYSTSSGALLSTLPLADIVDIFAPR